MLAWQDMCPICVTMFHPRDTKAYPNTLGRLPPRHLDWHDSMLVDMLEKDVEKVICWLVEYGVSRHGLHAKNAEAAKPPFSSGI